MQEIVPRCNPAGCRLSRNTKSAANMQSIHPRQTNKHLRSLPPESSKLKVGPDLIQLRQKLSNMIAIEQITNSVQSCLPLPNLVGCLWMQTAPALRPWHALSCAPAYLHAPVPPWVVLLIPSACQLQLLSTAPRHPTRKKLLSEISLLHCGIKDMTQGKDRKRAASQLKSNTRFFSWKLHRRQALLLGNKRSLNL